MKKRAIFKLNGKVVYDSKFQDDLEMNMIEDRDIADELRKYGKPSEIASVTFKLEVNE